MTSAERDKAVVASSLVLCAAIFLFWPISRPALLDDAQRVSSFY